MRNIVKYKVGTRNQNSIKSGNFNLGVNGTPSNLNGFYNGITPINGGYTIYKDKTSNGPSIYSPKNDTELIDIVEHLSGNIYSVNDALNWVLGQSTMTIVNHNYSNIVTDGLVLNLDAGFVSSYPRNGTTWNDLSGDGNDGTLVNGPTYDSANGGSIVFDGTNDYVGLSSALSSLDGTIEASLVMWIKLDNSSNGSGQSGIIQLSGWNNSNGNLYFYSNGYTYLDIFRTGRVSTVITNSTVDPTQWHMLTVTTTPGANGWKVYWNDILKYQTTGQSTVTVNSSIQGGFTLGRNSSTRELNGNINSCKIYDRALTQEEVSQNYYAGLQRLVPTDGLMISLNPTNTNLYATSTTTAYDISGEGNDGTLLNGVSVTSEGGGSWDFDGSNDYINIPFNSGGMDFSDGQTICMWLKPGNGASSARRNPYNQAYGGSGTITHELSGGFSYYFGTNGGNGSPYVGRGSSFTVSENELAFIVVSRNQLLNSCKWYKNGNLTNQANAGNYPSTNNGSSPITIGDGYVSNFIGDIFDLKVYNRGLTDDEVSIIYNSTKTKYE